jgi:CRP-like cAMP-binding protein
MDYLYLMEEFLPVINYVSRFITLTDEEKTFFSSLLRTVKVKKKQTIVQPEFVCKYRSYIVKGAMRAYLTADKGQEHTVALAVEDWWISDYNSYLYQTPATLFVEALEDTVLIQIEHSAEKLLLETHPKFERYLRIITERAFAFSQQRILSNLSKPAEERYEEFMSKYPGIANRIPQYALASYLGVSTEFLSKIKNNKVKKLK